MEPKTSSENETITKPPFKKFKSIASKIHKACLNNDTDKIIHLTTDVMEIDVVELNKKQTLFEAVNHQNVAIVKRLLEICLDVNICDQKGNTPLHFACQEGDLAIVDLLLQNGAKVDAKDQELDESALHRAISFEHFDIIKKLIEYDADVNLESRPSCPYIIGQSPLHLAVKCSNVKIVRKL